MDNRNCQNFEKINHKFWIIVKDLNTLLEAESKLALFEFERTVSAVFRFALQLIVLEFIQKLYSKLYADQQHSSVYKTNETIVNNFHLILNQN